MPGDATPPSGAAGADVAAVVVTFEPDLDSFVTTLRATANQLGRVVVVDNGSSSQQQLSGQLGDIAGVELVALEDNLGIATALNAGVRHLARGTQRWVLTLDQDTVLADGAVARVLGAFERLETGTKDRCGVIGLRYKEVERTRLLGRWAERGRQVSEAGEGFRERRLLLTSGNLVRAEVCATVAYEDELFLDQVDYAFSAAVRASGWSLLEFRTPLMNHQIGRIVRAGGRLVRYERGERLYYIVRNSTVLLRRRRLPVGVYLTQIASWSWAYLAVNGWTALPREVAIVVTGLRDAASGRLGRRRYRVLGEPPSIR